MTRDKNQPYMCVGSLGVFMPTDGCLPEWMIRVESLEDITEPSRANAYIMPNNMVYVWNYEGTDKIPLTGVSWGQIIGNLSDQTDLQTALDAKSDKISPSTVDNIATLTTDGNYKDSGQNLSDYARNDSLTIYEQKKNKKAIYNDATDEEYPTIPSVIQYVNSAIESIESGLRIPVSLDKESDLQDISTYEDGDYFFVQDMDETAEGHTGRIWVNTVDDVKQFFRVVDQYQSPDGSSIVLNGVGMLEVNSTWFNSQLPTTLPNPEPLVITQGENTIEYDGTTSKSINIGGGSSKYYHYISFAFLDIRSNVQMIALTLITNDSAEILTVGKLIDEMNANGYDENTLIPCSGKNGDFGFFIYVSLDVNHVSLIYSGFYQTSSNTLQAVDYNIDRSTEFVLATDKVVEI